METIIPKSLPQWSFMLKQDLITQIKKLDALKNKVKDQILGNDYYVAQELKVLEKKIDLKIAEIKQTLAEMQNAQKEMI
jgi:hypothetical protein